MIPYTTPTFLIRIDEAQKNRLEDTDHIWVDFKQGNLSLQKRDGITIDPQSGTIAVTLSQEESGKFREGMIEIQLHGLMKDGVTAWKTFVSRVPVDRTLSEGAIT